MMEKLYYVSIILTIVTFFITIITLMVFNIPYTLKYLSQSKNIKKNKKISITKHNETQILESAYNYATLLLEADNTTILCD